MYVGFDNYNRYNLRIGHKKVWSHKKERLGLYCGDDGEGLSLIACTFLV